MLDGLFHRLQGRAPSTLSPERQRRRQVKRAAREARGGRSLWEVLLCVPETLLMGESQAEAEEPDRLVAARLRQLADTIEKDSDAAAALKGSFGPQRAPTAAANAAAAAAAAMPSATTPDLSSSCSITTSEATTAGTAAEDEEEAPRATESARPFVVWDTRTNAAWRRQNKSSSTSSSGSDGLTPLPETAAAVAVVVPPLPAGFAPLSPEDRLQQQRAAAARRREARRALEALEAGGDPTTTANSSNGDNDGGGASGGGGSALPLTAAVLAAHLTRLTGDEGEPHHQQQQRQAAEGVERGGGVAAVDEDDVEERWSRCSGATAQTASTGFGDDEQLDVQVDLAGVYADLLSRRMAIAAEDTTAAVAAPPTTRTAAASAATAAVSTSVAPRRARERSRYPLGSRHYIGRVVLTQSDQQIYALLALLTASYQHAWQLHTRLVQHYYYYINPALDSVRARGTVAEVTALEHSLRRCGTGALAGLHEQLAGPAPLDYQVQRCAFHAKWAPLFAAVKAHLGLGAGLASVSRPPSPPPPPAEVAAAAAAGPTGSAVCVAAMRLHAMELFQRHGRLQRAVREAEGWIQWFHHCYCRDPQRLLQQLLADQAQQAPDSEVADGGEDEGAYLPMRWHAGQDPVLRAAVYARRRERLRMVMEAAERARVAAPAATAAPSVGTAMAAAAATAPEGVAAPVAVLSGVELVAAEDATHGAGRTSAATHLSDEDGAYDSGCEEEGAAAAATAAVPVMAAPKRRLSVAEEEAYHRKVEVGCFGFTFISPFD